MAVSRSSLEDYWTEFHDIESTKDPDEEEEEDELPKTPDGEQEARWLKEVGLDAVVNRIKDGHGLTDDEMEAVTATLTSSQAAVVKRRVDTLSTTMRKRQKQNKTDVRDIFPSQETVNGSFYGSPGSFHRLSGGSIGEGQTTHDHVRHGSKPKERSFMKRGGYSMSGRRTDEAVSPDQTGIEMLSVHPKGTYHRPVGSRLSGGSLPSISDHEDIMFELKPDDSTHQSRGQQRLVYHQGSQQKTGDNLPNFTLVHDKLGVTQMSDLSASDMSQIRSLALLELTSMFDNHNITYRHRKAKKRVKDHGLFGVPLQALLENDRKIDSRVTTPIIFHDIIQFIEGHCLETEGILRVPGSTGRIKQLRGELEDRFYSGAISWAEVLPHDAAALLKQFLRELPVPLLTYEYIEAFAQVESIKEKKLQLQALCLLILLLPPVHRNTLQILLRFLQKVVSKCHANKMSLANVSMIMAPNLFLVSSNHSKFKGIQEGEISMAAGTSNIVRMLIKYLDILWTVPSFLVHQMRRQNEIAQQRKGRDKSIMKFLAKKDKSELYKKPPIVHEGDFEEGVIRVHAPNLTKSSTAIRLDNRMTAGHIVDRFRNSCGALNPANGRGDNKRTLQGIYCDPDKVSFAEEHTYLYETGGNICERCLDHKTNMMALYHVNPNAEWVIKTSNHR
ncbi:rho GTPase-activating protein 18-like [Mizuhopecten yessoensis]|uniref:Rho GTPase-activating protein 18 n=1 Tax=Mizuhopecten yessoensis TaxID=6573 RepID=A0A210QF00_MIZYE|nr:rho GTPase-activating protein 18-like [Mizuhopecten yessoensis]XP_021359716.1 rho GTPase-activating protein 18-like [Mizuhopecten yessoensis]XP_021359717.1 rho GTPase-activating protein 18-like [Mizuhopecten yessoensis]OWF47308.1 Rho GTPase-activating protein 18 [Mizuhopecten yessoensis]